MMTNFGYLRAGSLAEALKALGTPGARLHAGGLDLLGCARDQVFPVDRIVSISRVKELQGISSRTDGGVKIGAGTKLAAVAASRLISEKYPVLARAAADVGTPQIREQGSVGGNLCQRPRCWYFRSGLQCLKKGGKTCFAANGENQYHAIFGGGPCFCVHPSDVAVALAALQAQVLIAAPAGSRAVKLADFFAGPKKAVDKENVLLPGEILTEIHLPPAAAKTKSSFRKVRARGSFDFALASAAALVELDGEIVRTTRIVLGGVAPIPWRVEAAEKALAGKKLDASAAAAAAEAAVKGATPLKGNGYKVEMVKGAIEEALAALM